MIKIKKATKLFSVLLSFAILFAYAPQIAHAASSTVSLTVDSITDTSARIVMSVNVTSGESINAIKIEWSKYSDFPAASTESSVPLAGSVRDFPIALVADTTYYVRARLEIYETGVAGVQYRWSDNTPTFRSLKASTNCTIYDVGATYANQSQASLRASYSINNNGYATRVGFVYATNSNNLIADNSSSTTVETSVNTTAGTINQTMTGLNSGTTYYYKAFVGYYVNNQYAYQYSDLYTYVHNYSATSLTVSTNNAYYSNGRVYAEGSITSSLSNVKERGFVYSYSNPNPTMSDNNGVFYSTETGSTFSGNFQASSSTNRCYVRAFVTNHQLVTEYGASATVLFTDQLPVVTTVAVDTEYVTATGAEVKINVLSTGSGSLLERGVVYSAKNTNPTYDGQNCFIIQADDLATGETTISLDNLIKSTVYYVTAYAKNSYGTSYGAVLNFTTTAEDTVTTLNVTDITNTSARAGGVAAGNRYYTILEKGVVYSTNPSPVITNSRSIVHPGSETGEFWVDITNLTYNTKYYVRAYIRTIEGYTYGATRSFTTVNNTVVVINSVADIKSTEATVNAYVSPEIMYNVVERGVLYSTTNTAPTATSSDKEIKTDVSQGTGNFAMTLTGLKNNTKYYVRAYAKTSQGGYSYSAVQNFTTLDKMILTINYKLSNGTQVGTQTIETQMNQALDVNNLIVPAGYRLETSGFKYTVTGPTTLDLVVISNAIPIQAAEQEFIEGAGGYKFEPSRPITRIEVARIIYNLKADKNVNYVGTSFTDIAAGYQYADVINFGTYMNYFTGYPDNTFRPNNEITRAEVATIMYNVYNPQPKNEVPVNLKDIGDSWARVFITTAAQNGILTGYEDGTFRPGNNMTRAEATSMFSRAEKRTGTPLGNIPFIDVPTSHWAYSAIMNASIPRP